MKIYIIGCPVLVFCLQYASELIGKFRRRKSAWGRTGGRVSLAFCTLRASTCGLNTLHKYSSWLLNLKAAFVLIFLSVPCNNLAPFYLSHKIETNKQKETLISPRVSMRLHRLLKIEVPKIRHHLEGESFHTKCLIWSDLKELENQRQRRRNHGGGGGGSSPWLC